MELLRLIARRLKEGASLDEVAVERQLSVEWLRLLTSTHGFQLFQ